MKGGVGDRYYKGTAALDHRERILIDYRVVAPQFDDWDAL